MFQVRVVRIHEPVQLSGKEVYLPFIKGSLYPPSIQAAAPVGIRVYGNTAALPDSFLYNPHQDKGNHTDKKVRRDMFRCTYIKGRVSRSLFITRNWSSICVRPWYFSITSAHSWSIPKWRSGNSPGSFYIQPPSRSPQMLWFLKNRGFPRSSHWHILFWRASAGFWIEGR